jgi:hypothetical protein
MLNVLSFDKLAAYSEFMKGVRTWQAENIGKKVTEEYKEYWGLEKFTGLHRAGLLSDSQFDAISRFYTALQFKPDKSIITLYTRDGAWQDSQFYGPIIQWADKERSSLVMNVNREKIPLELAQGQDTHGIPQIWITAQIFDESHSTSVAKVLNSRGKPMKFRGVDGKDFQVDRLVGLLPVSPDRRTLVEIPFHPGSDYYKSDSIYQAYQTGDLKTFWDTCQKELSVAGAGMQGGPIIDANRLFRGRARTELLRDFTERHGGLIILCETFQFVPGDFPAWAFKADLTQIIRMWGDEPVEGWGEKPKPIYHLSEVVWVSISANSKLTEGFDKIAPQPCLLNILGPNRKNPDYIPQMQVLPICYFAPEKQQKLFGKVHVPAAIMPAPVKPETVVDIIPVEASEVF